MLDFRHVLDTTYFTRQPYNIGLHSALADITVFCLPAFSIYYIFELTVDVYGVFNFIFLLVWVCEWVSLCFSAELSRE